MLRILALSFLCALPATGQTLGPSLSGDARMGIVYAPKPTWAGQRQDGLRLTSRARLQVQFVGETDGGLVFGAQVDLDKDREHRSTAAPRVFIGGGS